MNPSPPRTTPSPRAALLVVLLAVLLLVAFGTLSAVLGGNSQPSSHLRAPTGTTLVPVKASSALRSISRTGVPPANVSNAIFIPSHSRLVSSQGPSIGVGLFQATVHFQVPASELDVISFFKKAMPEAGWRIESVGPPSNGSGIEILGQIAGSDGWYWQMGATVAPTTFPTSYSSRGNGLTAFTLELYQQNDPD